MDRSGWHPKARAALSGYPDGAIPRSREDLLAISGIGEKSVEAILESLRAAAFRPAADAREAGRPPAPPPGPPAPSGNGVLPPAALYPSAAKLFPLIFEQGGDRMHAQERAVEVARGMGGGEALLAEEAFRMLAEFYRSGRVPNEQDAREAVRLARAVYEEISHPTRSPFDDEEEAGLPLEG